MVTLTLDLFTLNQVRFIVRGVGNLPTNFGVSETFPSPLKATDSQTDYVILQLRRLTLEVMALLYDTVFVFHQCTKFEVRRPSRSEDIAHLLCEH